MKHRIELIDLPKEVSRSGDNPASTPIGNDKIELLAQRKKALIKNRFSLVR